MGKIGVNQANWNKVVSQGSSGVSSISVTKPKPISKTTLKRFTQFPTLEADIQKVLTHYKEANQMETTKMKSAGQKIVDEDGKAARQLNQNTEKMRAIK